MNSEIERNHTIEIPCGCCLTWGGEEAVMVLCLSHGIQYDVWRTDRRVFDEENEYEVNCEFIKMITSRQKEMKSISKTVLKALQ